MSRINLHVNPLIDYAPSSTCLRNEYRNSGKGDCKMILLGSMPFQIDMKFHRHFMDKHNGDGIKDKDIRLPLELI